MQQLHFRAMGCQMLAALDSAGPDADAALAQVPAWFEAWEQSLSRFRADSELSRLNAHAGEWTNVSETMWAVLSDALWAAAWSGGLVSPTMLGALEQAGYDRSFDQLPAAPEPIAFSRWGTLSANASEPARPAPADWRDVQLDSAKRAVRLPKGARLDLGGVAKGWAGEQAARKLSAIAPALVDAGGDVCVSGPMSDDSAWPIGIADPFEPERDLAVLAIRAGCVATSGRDFRRWERDGRPMHHVIDPRTSQPAQTDAVSVSVVAPTAREAETAAKTALILGSVEGARWLTATALAGLLVLENGEAVRAGGFDELAWR